MHRIKKYQKSVARRGYYWARLLVTGTGTLLPLTLKVKVKYI